MKKESLKFSLTRRGYDRKEVDSYIEKLDERNTKQILEYQKGFLDLKSHCASLESELKDMKKKEDDIKQSLFAANDKANELKIDLKIQYAMEIERLKLFQAKWTNCYEELKERYKFDKDALNMESIVAQTAVEIETMLNRDFRIPTEGKGGEIEKQFKNEVKRLNMDDEEMSLLFDKMKSELIELKEKKERKIASDDGKFSFEKALRPEKSMEELCRDVLGKK